MGLLQDLETQVLPVDRLRRDGIASASIAILDNGKISSHVITSEREDTETVYQSCSISKAITALAVAKLVDQGRIQYETKVIEHLPRSTIECLVDESTAHLMEHVTVGMLLSHTSGLSQGGFPGYAGDMPSAEDILAGRPPSNTPKVYFKTFPTAQFSYSGGGFTVLQLVLEHVTNMSFAELMRITVLQPLNMTRSRYGRLEDGETNYAKARVTASTAFPRAAEYHHFVEIAAAGLWSTPTDLLKAISSIQESLHSDSGFLSRTTANKMLTQVVARNTSRAMALGWAATDIAFGHTGGNEPGYCTYVFGFLGTRRAVAIMTNSTLGHDRAIKQITGAIFYLNGWHLPRPLPCYFNDDDYVPYAASKDTAVDQDWKEWMGSWGDWRLVDQDGPAWKYKSMDPMRLMPAAAPVAAFEDEKEELFFVVDGLEVGLRLTWSEGERVVHLLQAQVETLKRSIP